MALLDEASTQKLQRLLELFPAEALREKWPGHAAKKMELAFEVASARETALITQFVSQYFGCCKQHIYCFEHDLGADVAALDVPVIESAELLARSESDGTVDMLYCADFEYYVVLRDVLERTKIEFLWPFRLILTPSYILVKFVTLAKNLSSYLPGQSYYLDRTTTDESTIITQVRTQLGLRELDLHRGIRHLWDSNYIDSAKAKFLKSDSVSSESMHAGAFLKARYPDIYASLVDAPILHTLFVVHDEQSTVDGFAVNPSKGYITFPKYTGHEKDVDELIKKILDHNLPEQV